MSYVEIDLDKPRRLRFDLAALRDLQRRLGNPTLLQIANRISEIDLECVVQAYYAALRWDDKNITPNQVEGLLQKKLDAGGNMSELITPLSEAFVNGAGLRRSTNGDGGDTGKA